VNRHQKENSNAPYISGGYLFFQPFSIRPCSNQINAAKKTKGKRNQKLLTTQTLVGLVELLGSVGPLLVNAEVTVVAGVSSVDALVVLLGLLLDALDGLGEGGWRGWR